MNLDQCRRNMVDCQLQTNGVTSPEILEAFAAVPRECFVPDARRALAYADEDLPLGEGRFLLEPAVHARLVEAAAPRREDMVLDVGGATGYSAAILARLAGTVIALEEMERFADSWRSVWDDLTACNIVTATGPLEQGYARHAPYSLIFVNGSMAEIPKSLLGQLAEGGRLCGILAPERGGVGHAVLLRKHADGCVSRRYLFDAFTPYLPGMEPVSGFVF